MFRDRARSALGTDDFAQFEDPKVVEKLTNLYLARWQIALFGGSTSSSANALTLLSTSQR